MISNLYSPKSEKQREFIKLRIAGKSYDTIAKLLGVSKPTLIKWGKTLSGYIQEQQKLRNGSLADELDTMQKQSLDLILQELEKVQLELSSRDLSDIPTERLYKIHGQLINNLQTLKPEDKSEDLNKMSWVDLIRAAQASVKS